MQATHDLINGKSCVLPIYFTFHMPRLICTAMFPISQSSIKDTMVFLVMTTQTHTLKRGKVVCLWCDGPVCCTNNDEIYTVEWQQRNNWLINYLHRKWWSRLCLTHWGRDKMAAISQTTLSIAFSLMKMVEFSLKFHWSLFIRVQLTIFQHWFRWWLGADQATIHYLKQWWLDYRRIYASVSLNELTHWPLGYLNAILKM